MNLKYIVNLDFTIIRLTFIRCVDNASQSWFYHPKFSLMALLNPAILQSVKRFSNPYLSGTEDATGTISKFSFLFTWCSRPQFYLHMLPGRKYTLFIW
jgi:hypothetical protein